jgi:hypothetical protein
MEKFVWHPVADAPRTKLGKPLHCVFWFGPDRFHTGDLHNLDGTPFGHAGHLHGDAIHDWGATHFMLLEGPRT